MPGAFPCSGIQSCIKQLWLLASWLSLSCAGFCQISNLWQDSKSMWVMLDTGWMLSTIIIPFYHLEFIMTTRFFNYIYSMSELFLGNTVRWIESLASFGILFCGLYPFIAQLLFKSLDYYYWLLWLQRTLILSFLLGLHYQKWPMLQPYTS